jgi:hypothetical protein
VIAPIKRARAVYATWRAKPTATTLPLIMIITGAIALILGDESSTAFAHLGGGTLVRVMGACMFLGGVGVLAGILRDDAVLEPIGLTLAALGAMVYGTIAILGLGTHGVITGIDHIAIAVGFLGRIALLLSRAPRIPRTPD